MRRLERRLRRVINPLSASRLASARVGSSSWSKATTAVPEPVSAVGAVSENGRIERRDLLGGLIHEYQLAA